MLHAVIMAGGGGTRFWPRSRKARPKQFLTLAGDRSLLQMALDRIEGLAPPERTWVITGEAYRAETAKQLPSLPPDRDRRRAVRPRHRPVHRPGRRPDRPRRPRRRHADDAGRPRHRAGAGVPPGRARPPCRPPRNTRRRWSRSASRRRSRPPATATSTAAPRSPAATASPSSACAGGFREKPNADLAERFVASGEYFWNSGIFVWKVAAVLAQLREQRPALYSAVQRIADAWAGPNRTAVLRSEYEAMEKISIDYAVMEHAPEVLVVQAPYRWDDVGSWLALERMNPQDADDNTVLAEHCGVNTQGCVIVGDPGRLIGTIGVSNLLIIQDGDATLIADRREEGAVKKLVELLQKKGLEKYL